MATPTISFPGVAPGVPQRVFDRELRTLLGKCLGRIVRGRGTPQGGPIDPSPAPAAASVGLVAARTLTDDAYDILRGCRPGDPVSMSRAFARIDALHAGPSRIDTSDELPWTSAPPMGGWMESGHHDGQAGVNGG
jgi:hypothetical protein